MNAPPGVDSDSSSGEDVSPPYSPVSPDNKPHFSLKALFLPGSKLDKPAIKDAAPIMEDQFVGSGVARAPSPIQLRAPKKKVRIHVDGEDHPDSPRDESGNEAPLDLVGSPMSPMSVGDAGSPWAGAMSPISSPGNGPPANEVFDLLRQILVDRTQGKERDGSGGARLELVDESSDSEAAPPAPDPYPLPSTEEGKRIKEKPSRIMATMFKLKGPRKATQDSQQQNGNDSSSSFGATDGHSSAKLAPSAPPIVRPPSRPTPANARSPEGLSNPSTYDPSPRPDAQYIDPSNRMSDGRKAHGLAEEYFHPEKAREGQENYREEGRQSTLPYRSQAVPLVNDTSPQARDSPIKPWLHFPSPWQPAPQTLPQPPHSVPVPPYPFQHPYNQSLLLNQKENYVRQSQPQYAPQPPQPGDTYYESAPRPSSYLGQIFDSTSQRPYHDYGGYRSQTPYQQQPQAPTYPYQSQASSHAPHSVPWTAPALAPTHPPWNPGYYPRHWSCSSPTHPRPFPHPTALQPWQPYYLPCGCNPHGPLHPSAHPILQPEALQNSVLGTPLKDQHAGPGPLSPLNSLPNPHDPPASLDNEKRKGSVAALQADGLRLRPGNEAKSPVKTRLHGLPGSMKVKVEEVVDDVENQAVLGPSGDGGKENAVSSAPSKAAAVQSSSKSDRDKLKKVVAQRDELKKRIVEGKLDKEKGKKELDQLTKLRDPLQVSVQKDKVSKDPTKSDQDAGSKAGSSISAVENERSARSHNEVKGQVDPRHKLKLVMRQREELKKRIAQGKIDREKGKGELVRLTKLRDQLLSSTETANGSESVPTPETPVASSSTSEPNPRSTAKSVPEEAQNDATPSLEQLKQQIPETEKRMVRVKSKMLDKSLDHEEGERMLAKLDKSRKKLREMLHRFEQGQGKSGTGPEGGSIASIKPVASDSGETQGNSGKGRDQEAHFAQIESRMKKIKEKIKDGSLPREDAEKEMKKLIKAREAVSVAGGAGDPASKHPEGRGHPSRSRDDDESLDPEILKQVLSDIPNQSPLASKGNPREETNGPIAHPDAKSKTKLPEKAHEDSPALPKESRTRTEPALGVQADDSASKSDQVISQRPSIHIPGAWQNPSTQPPAPPAPSTSSSSREVTWSKCLVSLAHCIDLGSDLSAHLLRTHSDNELHSREGQNFLIVEVLPRLLTSLVLQRDIVSSMRGVLGEQHSEAMGAFLEHILIVKRFLEVQHAKKREPALKKGDGDDDKRTLAGIADLHNGLISGLESGSLQAIMEHLLGMSDFLTPHLLETLREVLQEWKEEGLSVSSIIHVTMTLRKELTSVSESKAQRLNEDKAKVEPTGTLDLLDRLLRFIDRDGQKRKSIQDQPGPSATRIGRPSRHEQRSSERTHDEQSGTEHHDDIKDKVAQVLLINRDKARTNSAANKTDRANATEPRESQRPEDRCSHCSTRSARMADASEGPASPSAKSVHPEPPGQQHHRRAARSARVEDIKASKPLPPGDTIHREPHSAKEIRLPSSTEEFLNPSTKHSSRPSPTNHSVTATPSKHDHHSTVVRPPGSASEAEGSHHHAIVGQNNTPTSAGPFHEE